MRISLCTPGCPVTLYIRLALKSQRSVCFCFLSAESKVCATMQVYFVSFLTLCVFFLKNSKHSECYLSVPWSKNTHSILSIYFHCFYFFFSEMQLQCSWILVHFPLWDFGDFIVQETFPFTKTIKMVWPLLSYKTQSFWHSYFYPNLTRFHFWSWGEISVSISLDSLWASHSHTLTEKLFFPAILSHVIQ